MGKAVFATCPAWCRILQARRCRRRASPNSPRAGDRLSARELRIVLEDPSAKVQIVWKAILREGANYVRQEVTIRALHQPFALAQIGLIDAVIPGATVSGRVKGSPVAAGGMPLGW